jgi:hypothetical protein
VCNSRVSYKILMCLLIEDNHLGAGELNHDFIMNELIMGEIFKDLKISESTLYNLLILVGTILEGNHLR